MNIFFSLKKGLDALAALFTAPFQMFLSIVSSVSISKILSHPEKPLMFFRGNANQIFLPHPNWGND